MKIFILLFLFIVNANANPPSHGIIKKTGDIGCLTYDKLDEMFQFANNKDYDGLQYLLDNYQCVYMDNFINYKYSVLDRGFLTSKVRIYVKKTMIELVVPAEFVRECEK